ncbi:DUF6402 family protein [Cupriavidus sp. BIS7]|uniref:DUF6402 family protein n=1 Tax=Cupriavidus sp. BIS7 TaxID=1217718 RepID=UPI001ED95E54|nr:DUF6402 family protein [Cupriavidus sp. BIS7]
MENADQFPYLRKSLLGPWWKEADNKCTIESADEFELSMNKPAPPLRDQPPPPLPPKAPPKPKDPPTSVIEGLVDAVIKVREWANSPPAPKPAPAAAPAIHKPRVKPFDLQDIPGAMRKIGWLKSAEVMGKWFAGPLNYANTDEGAVRGINHEGKPFPPAAVDTKTFDLKWILQFPRAKKKFDELVNLKLFNPAANAALRLKFSRRQPSPYYVDTWNILENDIQRWHRDFQYQRVDVDDDELTKLEMFARGLFRPNGLWMDDLYGSLGAFSFYAAVSGFSYRRVAHTRTSLRIHEVCIYMRDVFTFHDRSNQRGTQYLGHWNKTGFIVVPISTIFGELTKADWPNYPVARNGVISENSVYYPVRNMDYRRWQLRYGQGSDLVLYSNVHRVPFYPPKIIEFDL